ncbi:MAG: phosphate ABC transporter permease PstA [Planctomycetes bacterium]|nr:phosphate ABC transporter permease PstA [Planctomycetota bacterium]
MSPTTTTEASAERKLARRRGAGQRRTSLFAHGEPLVWLTGGALALAVVMILGLLLLVLRQGLPTFWPSEVVQVSTVAGGVHAGEVADVDVYRPEAHVLDALPEAVAARARASLAERDGLSERRMLRTGNYELTGTHYTWVSDFELAEETRPEWILVVERLENGRFYGTPRSIAVQGTTTEGDAQLVWDQFERHHDAARERWQVKRELETVEIGEVNRLIEAARLELREVELAHGVDSEPWRAAQRELEQRTHSAEAEFQRLRREIDALTEAGRGSTLTLVSADGASTTLALEEIVRAYPANRLSTAERIGVYLSRLAEFLFDEPREANSEGGVFPAMFGTVLMTLIMAVLVVPFGVLAALYLREYAKPGAVVSAVRIAINNLAGVPSIVFGVFGLGFFCYIVGANVDELLFSAKLPTPTYGKGGLMWASLTLALLTLPVVIVPTEEALSAVPRSMREGSFACGATKWQTIWRIVLPRALPGIMTGMILALARGAGEVAPLMLVGAVKLAPELPLDTHWPFLHPERSFMHLGFHIYDLGFQSQNSEAAKPMVYTTTLLLIGIVVALNVLAIWIRARLRRRFQGSQL